MLPHDEIKSKQSKTKPISFIWLGGPIPIKYLRSIQRLARHAREQGLEVQIVVEKSSSLFVSSEKEETGISRTNKKNKDIELVTLDKVKQDMRNHPFFNQMIKTETIGGAKIERPLWEIIENYIDRERIGSKNLGAGSDILRLVILYLYGGYYFDTDTEFVLNARSKLALDEAKQGFLIAGEFDRDDIFHGGIDMIYAEKNHKIVENAILNIIQNYHNLDITPHHDAKMNYKVVDMDAKREVKESYSPTSYKDRRQLTIEASGYALLNSMKDFLKNNPSIDPDSILFSEETQENDSYKILGIKAIRAHDNTWLNKKDKNLKEATHRFFSMMEDVQSRMNAQHQTTFDNMKRELDSKIKYKKSLEKIKKDFHAKKKPVSSISSLFSEQIEYKYTDLVRGLAQLCEQIFLAGYEKYLESNASKNDVDVTDYCKYLEKNARKDLLEWKALLIINEVYKDYKKFIGTSILHKDEVQEITDFKVSLFVKKPIFDDSAIQYSSRVSKNPGKS